MGMALALAAVAVTVGLMVANSPTAAAMANRRRTEGSGSVLRVPPPTTGMGRDRVGSQWYMHIEHDAPAAQPGAAPAAQPVPSRTIRWWSAGAASYAVLDVLAWTNGSAFLGVVLAGLCAVALGAVLRGWRRNRWLDQAKTWSTGHHHDIPPVEHDR